MPYIKLNNGATSKVSEEELAALIAGGHGEEVFGPNAIPEDTVQAPPIDSVVMGKRGGQAAAEPEYDDESYFAGDLRRPWYQRAYQGGRDVLSGALAPVEGAMQTVLKATGVGGQTSDVGVGETFARAAQNAWDKRNEGWRTLGNDPLTLGLVGADVATGGAATPLVAGTIGKVLGAGKYAKAAETALSAAPLAEGIAAPTAELFPKATLWRSAKGALQSAKEQFPQMAASGVLGAGINATQAAIDPHAQQTPGMAAIGGGTLGFFTPPVSKFLWNEGNASMERAVNEFPGMMAARNRYVTDADRDLIKANLPTIFNSKHTPMTKAELYAAAEKIKNNAAGGMNFANRAVEEAHPNWQYPVSALKGEVQGRVENEMGRWDKALLEATGDDPGYRLSPSVVEDIDERIGRVQGTNRMATQDQTAAIDARRADLEENLPGLTNMTIRHMFTGGVADPEMDRWALEQAAKTGMAPEQIKGLLTHPMNPTYAEGQLGKNQLVARRQAGLTSPETEAALDARAKALLLPRTTPQEIAAAQAAEKQADDAYLASLKNNLDLERFRKLTNAVQGRATYMNPTGGPTDLDKIVGQAFKNTRQDVMDKWFGKGGYMETPGYIQGMGQDVPLEQVANAGSARQQYRLGSALTDLLEHPGPTGLAHRTIKKLPVIGEFYARNDAESPWETAARNWARGKGLRLTSKFVDAAGVSPLANLGVGIGRDAWYGRHREMEDK